MSKKVNFAMIPFKDINGNDVTIDTTKELGNLMYMQGEDLAECELGQAIYHSNDEGPKVMELDDKQLEAVRKHASKIKFHVLKTAILEAVKPT